MAEAVHRCRILTVEFFRDGSCEARIVAYAFGVPQPESGFPPLHELVPLIPKLAREEPGLVRWLRSSETNAAWFRRAPFAALRAAGLGIEEGLLQELESVTRSVAQRLKENC